LILDARHGETHWLRRTDDRSARSLCRERQDHASQRSAVRDEVKLRFAIRAGGVSLRKGAMTGEQCREARERLNWTRHELATAADVPLLAFEMAARGRMARVPISRWPRAPGGRPTCASSGPRYLSIGWCLHAIERESNHEPRRPDFREQGFHLCQFQRVGSRRLPI
jgi:hypothetical protein